MHLQLLIDFLWEIQLNTSVKMERVISEGNPIVRLNRPVTKQWPDHLIEVVLSVLFLILLAMGGYSLSLSTKTDHLHADARPGTVPSWGLMPVLWLAADQMARFWHRWHGPVLESTRSMGIDMPTSTILPGLSWLKGPSKAISQSLSCQPSKRLLRKKLLEQGFKVRISSELLEWHLLAKLNVRTRNQNLEIKRERHKRKTASRALSVDSKDKPLGGEGSTS